MTVTCLRASGAVISLTSDSNGLQRNTAKLFVPCYAGTCLWGQFLDGELWEHYLKRRKPDSSQMLVFCKAMSSKEILLKKNILSYGISYYKIKDGQNDLFSSFHVFVLFLNLAVVSYLFCFLAFTHLSSGLVCELLTLLAKAENADETFRNTSQTQKENKYP